MTVVLPAVAPAVAERSPQGEEPLRYESPLSDESGESLCRVYGGDGRYRLHFPGRAELEISAEAIAYRLAPGASPHDAELLAGGAAFAFWHELGGRPCFHAAVVRLGGAASGTLGLLGDKEAGKSSLAAALLAEDGTARLLADDLLPLAGGVAAPEALPVAPRLRLHPEGVRCFLSPAALDRLEPVHPSTEKRWVPVGPGGLGRFHDRPEPLSRLYLLERSADAPGVALEPVAPAAAVIELVRHSFLARMVEALGWQPRRLEVLARVAERVPVRRLRYPHGLDRLGEVCRAIRADLLDT